MYSNRLIDDLGTVELSIVVCTRNRAEALREALPFFAKMETARTWELIFVDNGSTDGTKEILDDFVKSQSINCRVLYHPQPGLSRARNVGWKAASANIVSFTDDDCYPQSDYPSSILAAFEHDEKLGFVGGRVLLWDEEDLPITIQTSNEPVHIDPCSFISTGIIHGANMAMKKTLLERVGGFDELLGAGAKIPSGEDCDTLSLICSCGYSGMYDPKLVVFHHHRRKNKDDEIFLMKQYDLGRGAYFVKCIIEPKRRINALRNIYWSLMRKNNHKNKFLSVSNYCMRFRELKGALLYLVVRCF